MMRAGLFAFAAIWVLIAVPTVVARAPYECGVLLGQGCILQMANWFGDVATFQWGSQWATLTGSFVAILAAVIGATAINNQNREAERRHKAERMRKAESFRAAMPLAVSSVSEYLECTARVARAYHSALSLSGLASRPSFPTLPVEVVPTLQGIVEFEEDQLVRDRIVELVGDLQVTDARAGGIVNPLSRPSRRTNPLEVEDFLFGVCVGYAKNSYLFNYARRSPEAPEEIDARVWNAAFLLGIDQTRMPSLWQQLERRYGPHP